MAQIEIFLNAIRLVNNIFYLLFIGMIISYMIVYKLEKKENKLLTYISALLGVLVVIGIILTMKFISFSEQFIPDMIESVFVIIFIIFFVKLMIAFPKFSFRSLMRSLLIFLAVSNLLLIPVKFLFSSELYSSLQFGLFIIDFWIIYFFIIKTLISVEKKKEPIKRINLGIFRKT